FAFNHSQMLTVFIIYCYMVVLIRLGQSHFGKDLAHAEASSHIFYMHGQGMVN
ncbi:hypothetical protein WUBG_06528, partial [Wuchereria bancrofti]